MNDIALMTALATAPSSAFAELRQRPRFWFPLLVLVVSTAAVSYWYYSVVDFEWLKDILFGNNPDIQALPADQREAAMAMYSRSMMLWGSLVGVAIGIPIVFLVSALVLWLVAKVTKLPQELRLKHWFAFSTWASMPMLISTLVAAIMLLLSDSPQISPGIMQPLSLNEMVFHHPPGSPGQVLLDMLSIPALLCWALMIIGVRVWSQRSWTFSFLFIMVPSLIVYGTWAFFAIR